MIDIEVLKSVGLVRGGLLLCICAYFVFEWGKVSVARQRQAYLQTVANKARKARDAKVKAVSVEHNVPRKKEDLIRSLTVVGLLDGMASGKFTSVEVVKVYCKAARACHKYKAVTEEFFEEALEQAKASDERRRRGEKPRLLEGIPVSLKDQIQQKGALSTCGLAVYATEETREVEDGCITTLIREAGGIPFVRTNTPQSLMLPESFNAIWGSTTNPWDESRTSGGSSGGESSIIAAGGSVLGIGTDLGGSIRNPAAMAGTFGFKPTPARVSKKGNRTPRVTVSTGQEAILSATGPLGLSTADLVLCMQALWTPTMFRMDRSIPPAPFRQKEYDAKVSSMRIGWYDTDDFFESAPSYKRAVKEAVEALKQKGYTVKQFKQPSAREAYTLFIGLVSADGRMSEIRDGLQGEDLHDNYKLLYKVSRVPKFVRPFISSVLKATGRPRQAELLLHSHPKSAREFWQYCAKKQAYTDNFLAEMDKQGVDLLISPGMGLPALKHNSSKFLSASCEYNFLYNVLHFPAGIVPITTIRKDEQRYKTPPGQDDMIGRLAREQTEDAEGLPIAVQIAGKPFQDERVLRVMHDIETSPLRKFPKCPGRV